LTSTAIAAEVSRITKYFDGVMQLYPLGHDNGRLFDQVCCSAKSSLDSIDLIIASEAENEKRKVFLLNGNLNHHLDIQGLLSDIKSKMNRTDRLVAVLYNPYFRWLYQLADKLGLRKVKQPVTFITEVDLKNIAILSGFEVVRLRPVSYSPFKLLGLGTIINTILPLIPIVRRLSFATVAVLRPVIKEEAPISLSIIIPARNEEGNIENALKRLPNFGGAEVEVIYVEGHSKDQTWDEIQRVVKENKYPQFTLKAFQQPGVGKKDAVEVGFANASKDLLTILDADLTMPPELLDRFYNAYCSGQADFVNGNRLLYPMEPGAMRFLNHLGNIFFAKTLSSLLSIKIGDSLCGTKMFARHDLPRINGWWHDFGGYDPFGDYYLLFSAAVLGLGTVDIPIHYRDREYGDTNIMRFRHGLMLFRMVFRGIWQIKSGRRFLQK